MTTKQFLIAICSFALSVHSTVAELRLSYGEASKIALATDLPGKRMPGQCLPFARALAERLRAAGFQANAVTFTFQSAPGSHQNEGTISEDYSCHAAVIYNDGGRTYVMDNQRGAPLWVHQGSVTNMLQRFAGPDIAVLAAKPELDPSRHGFVGMANVALPRKTRGESSARARGRMHIGTDTPAAVGRSLLSRR